MKPQFTQMLQSCLLPILLIIATAATSKGGLRLVMIHDPMFNVSHVAAGMDGSPRVSGFDFEASVDELLGPKYLRLSKEGEARHSSRTLREPLDIPVDQHMRNELAKNGLIDTDAFVVDDVFYRNTWLNFLVLTPGDNAAHGSTPYSIDAPVIPHDIFPITVTNDELYRNGTLVADRADGEVRTLDSYDATTTDGDAYDFTEVGFGEIILPRRNSASLGVSRQQLAGNYERRTQLRDKHGNGWNVFQTFSVAANPTDVAGDLNYSGDLDIHDLQILEQNIERAPEQLVGQFLRLDVNNDAALNVTDIHYWVTDLTSTFVGDTNLDGEVKFDDFLALSANFGQSGGWAEGDFDSDGMVGFPDFLALSANFGGAANAAAAVPEPTAASLALFGLLGLIGFRKRR